MYDTIIIGAGAAGLTAAIYTCRKKMKTLIITVDVGGQTNLTTHIENYPGFITSTGPELMKKFEDQAKHFGAELLYGRTEKINKTDDGFSVIVQDGKTFEAKTVIIGAGKVHRKLGVPGEDKFLGRGVSTCVTCDAPFFKNKLVAVVGGGNSAVEGALELAEIAEKVYLIHRRDQYRADEITVEKLQQHDNIEQVLSHVPTAINGDKLVESIVVKDVNSNEQKTLDVHGVFIEIGSVVDTTMVKDLVELNDKGEIIINDRCATNVPGLFAAGDVTIVPFKQTVISAGEGAKAALECHRFLTGATSVAGDWAKK